MNREPATCNNQSNTATLTAHYPGELLMETIHYISCPDVAFKHLDDTVKRWLAGREQWEVRYPNPAQPTTPEDFMNAFDRMYDEYLNEITEDNLIIDLGDEIDYHNDLDHRIHRPDDDFADLSQAEEDALVHGMEDEDAEDEPACGDCGGCYDCMGQPEDCRFDTIAERDDFYAD